MTIYPVQYGENPRTFLYSASHIMKHDGLIEIFSDKGAELQIQFEAKRMQEAIAKVQELDTANDDTPIDDIFLLVEKSATLFLRHLDLIVLNGFKSEMNWQGFTFISLSI